MVVRRNEEEKTYFRSERFYCIDLHWYFATRENLEMGPYYSKADAEVELMFYVRNLNEGGIFADMELINARENMYNISFQYE